MKEKEIVFQSVGDYDDFNQHPKLHPLVSVIDFSKAAERYGHRMQFHFYAVMLKDVRCGDTRYGKQTYDYQEGTLVFIAPDQMLDVMDKSELYQPKGYALAFHPDLLVGTSLRRTIASYGFFAYDCHEALHISAEERAIVRDCLAKIEKELGSRYDKHSDKVIVANIELLLSYCSRFYERQFRMRTKVHQRTVQRLEALIEDYFTNGKSEELGLPTVAYCAEQLHFSPIISAT